MDVSDRDSLDGAELLDAVVSATGLPEAVMKRELAQILEKAGQNNAKITLDDLRAAMIEYLESTREDLIAAGQSELA